MEGSADGGDDLSAGVEGAGDTEVAVRVCVVAGARRRYSRPL